VLVGVAAAIACGVPAPVRAQPPPASPCPGGVNANFVATGVNLSGANSIHVAISKLDGSRWSEPGRLRFFPNDTLAFDPTIADLRDGEADVVYTVSGSNPGLGKIVARVDGWPRQCPVLDQPVNLGFRERVRVSLDLDGEGLQAGQPPPIFAVHLFSADGKQDVAAAAPLIVHLQTSLGSLGLDKSSAAGWGSQQDIPIAEGRAQSDPLYLKLATGDSGSGVIYASVRMSSGSAALHDVSFPLRSRLNDSRLFLFILVGALVWWGVSTALDQVRGSWDRRKVLTALLAAVAIAVVAFLVGPTRLGIDSVDQTSTGGAMVFGLMSAAIGLDGVLKKFLP
jgi:hypothetical protein